MKHEKEKTGDALETVTEYRSISRPAGRPEKITCRSGEIFLPAAYGYARAA